MQLNLKFILNIIVLFEENLKHDIAMEILMVKFYLNN